MSELETVKVPDIGDVDDVEIIEVLVTKGDRVALEDSLITVESDKASMEIPSPRAGTVTSVLVTTGDKVSAGTAIAVIDTADESSDASANAGKDHEAASSSTPAPTQTGVSSSNPSQEQIKTQDLPSNATNPVHSAASHGGEHFELVVVGAGPGGYTAAFRAADLGLKVLLIERYPRLGGVCLNVGCIPSKALLHTAAVIQETREMEAHGVSFAEPVIDIDKLRAFKDGVIGRLTQGLDGLARQRNVAVLNGVARFTSAFSVRVNTEQRTSNSSDSKIADNSNALAGTDISFDKLIIAAGSSSVRIPGLPYEDPRLIDSTGALALHDIPERLLIIGGGIIGLEMGCVYAGIGSRVTVVELSDGLMPGCDRDLVRPLEKRLRSQFENIFTGSKVTQISANDSGLKVAFEGGKSPSEDTFDRVLLAVGRRPNGDLLDAEKAGVEVDAHGFIKVNAQQQTNVEHIFAIGDIVSQPMLAHKATHEGKVAAEVAAGHKSFFDARTIPSVAYTDPEVAWMGLTETQAKASGVQFEKASFPWAASGRSLSMARSEGLTKIIFDPESKQILGAGMVGPNAGELIAEAVLALEMGADIEDLALSIHPHPTLSETLNFAAEVAEGTVTDIYIPKR